MTIMITTMIMITTTTIIMGRMACMIIITATIILAMASIGTANSTALGAAPAIRITATTMPEAGGKALLKLQFWLSPAFPVGSFSYSHGLERAVEVARADPPRLVRGDLLEELPALVDEAGRHGTVVVFHSAVAAYLSPPDRDRFQELMTGLVAAGRCHWVSNEAPQVLPAVTAAGPVPDGARGFVLGIDGQTKMSKSAGNAIPIFAEPDEIRRLVMSMVTDPQRIKRTDPGRPEVCNVCGNLHRFFSSDYLQIQEGERTARTGCVETKQLLAERIIEFFRPMRERRDQLAADPAVVEETLAAGAAKVRPLLEATMAEVRAVVGIGAR